MAPPSRSVRVRDRGTGERDACTGRDALFLVFCGHSDDTVAVSRIAVVIHGVLLRQHGTLEHRGQRATAAGRSDAVRLCVCFFVCPVPFFG